MPYHVWSLMKIEKWKKNEIWPLIFAGYVEFDSGGSQSGGEDKNSRYLTFSLWNVEVKKLHLCKTLSFVLLFWKQYTMQKVNAIFCPRVGSKDSGTWHFPAPFCFFNHLLAPIMGVFGYYGAARASIQLICALALTPTRRPALPRRYFSAGAL